LNAVLNNLNAMREQFEIAAGAAPGQANQQSALVLAVLKK
jgi:hypothetical protein